MACEPTGEQSTSDAQSFSQSQDDADGSGSRTGSKPPTPGLYVVATPIGNARDITLRALDILAAADILACEDTRVGSKLLGLHGVRPPKLVAYHEHNAPKARPILIEALKSGKIVALTSDAGTPVINDPGYGLIAECREKGIPVHSLPGPSAVLNALVLSGLPTHRFTYCGFPPPKSARRRTWLGEMRAMDTTLVFLESPRRLGACLSDMVYVLGPREGAVLREMTKKFEEVRTGTLAELADRYRDTEPLKGEITIVVGPPDADQGTDPADIDAQLTELLKTESVREASARLALETGLPKRDIYSRALELKSAAGVDKKKS